MKSIFKRLLAKLYNNKYGKILLYTLAYIVIYGSMTLLLTSILAIISILLAGTTSFLTLFLYTLAYMVIGSILYDLFRKYKSK